MNKTVKAYHPLEMSYHKFMLKQVFLLIVTGLPFFSKSLSFIAYVIGYPLSILLKNNEPITTGLAFFKSNTLGKRFFIDNCFNFIFNFNDFKNKEFKYLP